MPALQHPHGWLDMQYLAGGQSTVMDLMAMDGNGNLTAMDRLMVMDGNGRQLTDGWSGAMAMDGAMATRRQLDGKGRQGTAQG